MTDTQNIKDRLDLAQIIGEYVQLKRAGINWKGRCPFHNEKTPSFMVQPEKQIWHCFGCGKGGDVFSFIQEIEGLDFSEALKLLAERAGVQLDNFRSEIDKSQKNRILAINTAAANFFHRFLLEIPAAKPARDYLARRVLRSETIVAWKVGYITDQWDLLTQYLLKKKFAIDDLVAAGLTIKKDNASAGRGYYDRFRGRIMFPLWDTHGNIVGFTGRILVETEKSGGKYVNTPQTLVYDKSRVLYGLDKAKTEIKAKDLVVIVEGQMDVIACHQAGMKNVVAASGTALTPEQVKLIKRYTSNVAMAFDADSAGQQAMKRGIDAALTEGLNIRVIQVPEGAGKDADEVIKKNPQVWRDAVANAVAVMDWYFAGVLGKYNINDPRQKQLAVNELLAEVNKISFPVERDDWLKRLADKFSVDTVVLRESLKKMDKNKKIIQPQNQPAEIVRPPAAASRRALLARAFWGLLFKFPDYYKNFESDLNAQHFQDTDGQALYELCQNQYNTSGAVNPDILRSLGNSGGDLNLIDLIMLAADKDYTDLNHDGAGLELRNLLEQIVSEWLKERRAQLQKEVAVAEKIGDKAKLISLIQTMQSLK